MCWVVTPIASDHGRYLCETYSDLISNGQQVPYYDTIPSEHGEGDESPQLPNASYVELQTITATRTALGRICTRRAQPRIYLVNLWVSGTIGEQDEQDFSMVESPVTQDEDTGKSD